MRYKPGGALCPRNTYKSTKIEDDLEGKYLKETYLKVGRNAGEGKRTHLNTPWAPSDPERIYWAQGPPGIGARIGPG